MKEPLKDFGPVYVINVKSNEVRHNHIQKEFKKYEVENYQIFEAVEASTTNLGDLVSGVESLPITAPVLACGLSHLKAIRHWLETSQTEHAIFIEDDLTFDTVEYWQWDWNTFLALIEPSYDILQLAIINNGRVNTSLHFREFRDWSSACYLVKRSWAEKLVAKHFLGDKIIFPSTDRTKIVPEGLVYSGAICLSFPLFVANENLGESINKHQAATMHQKSWDEAMTFWKTRPTTLTRKIEK